MKKTETNKLKRRALRLRSTQSERILWQALRNRYLLGYKFRRQHSVGPYVLDFYCPELKLAIEVDGVSHDTPEAQEYDRNRQAIIETYGIRFLRLRDEFVRESPESALRQIDEKIRSLSPGATAKKK